MSSPFFYDGMDCAAGATGGGMDFVQWVRRVALVCLAAFASNDARASYADEGAAYSACIAYMAASGLPQPSCEPRVYQYEDGFSGCYFSPSSNTTKCPYGPFLYAKDQKCSSRQTETGWEGIPVDGSSMICSSGCMYEGTFSVDAGASGENPYTFNPTGSACKEGDAPGPTPWTPPPPDPDPEDPPPPDGGGDDPPPPPPSDQPNPDPPDPDPSDPDPDNPDPYPYNPNPSPSDGNADDHEAGGGMTCGEPPTCGGDAILCAQLYQQWRTRCNTENDARMTGGATCQREDIPQCSGASCNALAYAAVLQQWRTRCQGDANANGQPDWTEIKAGEGSDGRTGEGADDANVFQTRDGAALFSQIDQSGFLGGGGSCPALPVFDLGRFGQFDPTSDLGPYWCQLIALLRGLILLSASIVSLRILVE